MSIKIEIVRPATEQEWDYSWNKCSYATYYQSREWAQIWQSYTNGKIRPFPERVSFSDGKNVVVPMMREKVYGGLMNRYSLVGPPFIVEKYGNWLTNDTLTNKHIVVLSNYLTGKYKNLRWRLNPYDENSRWVSVNSKYILRKPLITFSIDLSGGEDHVYSKLKQSCRNHIKQAINNKLIVTEGKDINHWKKYYEIYQDTIKRWGAKTLYTFDWKIYESLFYKNYPSIKLWLVWYNDIAIAGGIYFYSHGKILGWQMASLTAYRRLRPVHLLEHTIIKDGINKNYCWYDLGTAGGNKGLENFKKSFGPEKIMCDMIISRHPLMYTIKKFIR